MFKIYDVNGDDHVCQKDMFIILKQLIGRGLSDSQLQEIVQKTIKDLDHDGDGQLNLDEFKQVRKKDRIHFYFLLFRFLNKIQMKCKASYIAYLCIWCLYISLFYSLYIRTQK